MKSWVMDCMAMVFGISVLVATIYAVYESQWAGFFDGKVWYING